MALGLSSPSCILESTPKRQVRSWVPSQPPSQASANGPVWGAPTPGCFSNSLPPASVINVPTQPTALGDKDWVSDWPQWCSVLNSPHTASPWGLGTTEGSPKPPIWNPERKGGLGYVCVLVISFLWSMCFHGSLAGPKAPLPADQVVSRPGGWLAGVGGTW